MPAFAARAGSRSWSTASTSSGGRGKIPEIPIYVDSPLAVDVTTVFRLHPEVFDQRERLVGHPRAGSSTSPWFATSARSRSPRRSTPQPGPMVIVAASGMAESGRILHHLAHGIGDHRNLVLFVGFQAEHTLGRRIKEGADPVRIFGDELPVRAEVESIDGYSAHADRGRAARLGAPARRTDPAGVRGPRGSSRARGDGKAPQGGRACGTCGFPDTARASTCEPVPRRRSLRSTVGLVLFAAGVVYTVALAAVLITSQHDQRRPVDAIVVLGAAQYNGRPSPVLRARLDHAIVLYREGYAPMILVTGGVGRGDTTSEAHRRPALPGGARGAAGGRRGTAGRALDRRPR